MHVQTSDSSFHVSSDHHCRDPIMSTLSAAGGETCNVRLSPWWFASALCPLLAGTLGPLATAFNTCSLTTGWKHIAVRYQDETQTHALGDPQCAQLYRLIALNAVSVGSGFIANAIVFLFIWRKFSFCICTVGLLIQSSILISLSITTRSSTLWPKISGSYHFTQAYYYAIIAAILSTTTLVCVAIHGFGAIKKYYSIPLRTEIIRVNLFRQLIALTVYLLLGATLYAHIENWSYLDAVFWADFTILTIGLGGDLTPKTSLGRGLLLPYAIVGIVLIALLAISIRKLLLEGCGRLTDHLIETSRELLEKRLLTNNGTSVSMNNENTFNLVRRIPLDAKRRCGLIAYALSIIATLILLLGGASIFNIAEKDQSWTYGVSLYFAYVSLVTIGYGDYVPESESSKPFFVVWSLLSVPILTIFINTSVDTVYGSVRGLVPFCVRLIPNRQCYEMRVLRPSDSLRVPPNPISRYRREAEDGRLNVELSPRRAYCLPRLMFLESGEPSRIQGATSDQTSQAELHSHCYRLAKELSVVIEDVVTEPGKKYSYKEWDYYVNLMGEPQQDIRQRSTCNHVAALPFLNWASRGTPILLQSEAKWISLWLSSEIANLSHTLVSQGTDYLAL
ncbi:hypothetical protein GQ44DRAFT_764863 [Phaeosphaeriaceae sp. PMI808]|nr:hypothetical protein GQ44DRAFT_764863 [Phaeosphaeriaceae sp. PMI808]